MKKIYLFFILILMVISSASTQTIFYKDNILSSFNCQLYRDYKVPISLKKDSTLLNGRYVKLDQEGNVVSYITYNDSLSEIIYAIYSITYEDDNDSLKTFERFIVKKKHIIQYEQYLDDILFSYTSLANYDSINRPVLGNLQITNDIKNNQILIFEQINDTISLTKVYEDGILILEGNYKGRNNENKNGKWQYWNKESRLKKEEFWDKGKLLKTKEYDEQGKLIKTY